LEFDSLVSVALGIALAATTGFRVFLPLLVMSVASQTGYLSLSEGFTWLSTSPALVMLAVAAIVEILAYYIPGLDHLLDTIAAPTAIAAGIGVSAAVMTDLSPLLKWTLAILAGGGAAALTQGTTTLVRAHSGIFTAGIANPIVATAELGGAILMSLVSLAAPFIAIALLVLFCLIVFRLGRTKQSRPSGPTH
jgi:Domain of unknown function (DUF4126)